MSTSTKLANPLSLAQGQGLKNRFLKSATSEQLGDKDHNPKEELARLYQTWSEGGAGVLITGNIMVDRTALGEPYNVVLDELSDLDMFSRWTHAGTRNGNHLWAQLNHPGKQSPKVLSKAPVAPSAIPLTGDLANGFNQPTALTESEIKQLVRRFGESAKLAKQVGFTGVQIHAAHGYLVSQFLSPRHNQRTDQWGGSLANRMRFLLAIYKAMRNQVGDSFLLAVKLNSADFQKGGFTEQESMEVVDALVNAGIDFVEISGGNYESPAMVTGKGAKASTVKREAYFLDYAVKLRNRTNIPLAITGGFRSAEVMNNAIANNDCDVIGLARPMIMQPDLPNRAMADISYSIDWKEPTTGSATLDALTMLVLVWYEKQMWRLGKGQAVKWDQSPLLAAVSSIWKVLTKPRQYRRG